MSEWKVGDLALCIKGGVKSRRGCVYTVSEVVPDGSATNDGYRNRTGQCALRFFEFTHDVGQAAGADRFRRLDPHKADEDDREVIALLTYAPLPTFERNAA